VASPSAGIPLLNAFFLGRSHLQTNTAQRAVSCTTGFFCAQARKCSSCVSFLLSVPMCRGLPVPAALRDLAAKNRGGFEMQRILMLSISGAAPEQ